MVDVGKSGDNCQVSDTDSMSDPDFEYYESTTSDEEEESRNNVVTGTNPHKSLVLWMLIFLSVWVLQTLMMLTFCKLTQISNTFIGSNIFFDLARIYWPFSKSMVPSTRKVLIY